MLLDLLHLSRNRHTFYINKASKVGMLYWTWRLLTLARHGMLYSALQPKSNKPQTISGSTPSWNHTIIVIMGVRRNFSRGGNVNILLILVRLLSMQCKCTFTKRLVFSTRLNHKRNAHVTTTVTKMRFFGRHSHDNFHNALSADFQNRVLFFTEVLPWLSQKQQIKMREKICLPLLLP